MADIKWQEVNEQRRVYSYLSGGELYVIEIENVTHIEVRPSGKHRLETSDGRKMFVAPGWISLEIDSEDDWKF